MTKEDLIPIQSNTKAKELGKKGGSVVSLKKKYANLVTQSHNARCKNCKANCPFKQDNIQESKTHKCICPEARASALWHKKPVIDKEILLKLSHEALTDIINLNKTEKYGGKLSTVSLIHSKILEQLKQEYPPTQKSEVVSEVNLKGGIDLEASFNAWQEEEKEEKKRDGKQGSSKEGNKTG